MDKTTSAQGGHGKWAAAQTLELIADPECEGIHFRDAERVRTVDLSRVILQRQVRDLVLFPLKES